MGRREQVNPVCILSFQVSVHQSGKEDGFTASEIYPRQGALRSEYKYMCACHSQDHFDKPAAVNYEWACREGDRLVNMQR